MVYSFESNHKFNVPLPDSHKINTESGADSALVCMCVAVVGETGHLAGKVCTSSTSSVRQTTVRAA